MNQYGGLLGLLGGHGGGGGNRQSFSSFGPSALSMGAMRPSPYNVLNMLQGGPKNFSQMMQQWGPPGGGPPAQTLSPQIGQQGQTPPTQSGTRSPYENLSPMQFSFLQQLLGSMQPRF